MFEVKNRQKCGPMGIYFVKLNTYFRENVAKKLGLII
jgi:hypothetical protein